MESPLLDSAEGSIGPAFSESAVKLAHIIYGRFKEINNDPTENIEFIHYFAGKPLSSSIPLDGEDIISIRRIIEIISSPSKKYSDYRDQIRNKTFRQTDYQYDSFIEIICMFIEFINTSAKDLSEEELNYMIFLALSERNIIISQSKGASDEYCKKYGSDYAEEDFFIPHSKLPEIIWSSLYFFFPR